MTSLPQYYNRLARTGVHAALKPPRAPRRCERPLPHAGRAPRPVEPRVTREERAFLEQWDGDLQSARGASSPDAFSRLGLSAARTLFKRLQVKSRHAIAVLRALKNSLLATTGGKRA